MNDEVIIFVSDDNYIEHVKSLSVNCRVQGKYKGDFAVICPKGSGASSYFEEHGFYVLQTDAVSFMQKFFVFDEYFKKWKRALYLDCDIIVQDDLSRLFSLLGKGNIFMDTEDVTTLVSFWRDTKAFEHKEIYDWMQVNYPHVNNQTFNSAFILFLPIAIPFGTPQKLIDIQKKIEPINSLEIGGTDQQPINLLLWNDTKHIPGKMVCFWGCAEPVNNIVSEWRGWVGGEIPVAVHYSRWYAMWIEKTPNMDAYLNHHLNIPCHELYQQNLLKFDQIFQPCKV